MNTFRGSFETSIILVLILYCLPTVKVTDSVMCLMRLFIYSVAILRRHQIYKIFRLPKLLHTLYIRIKQRSLSLSLSLSLSCSVFCAVFTVRRAAG